MSLQDVIIKWNIHIAPLRSYWQRHLLSSRCNLVTGSLLHLSARYWVSGSLPAAGRRRGLQLRSSAEFQRGSGEEEKLRPEVTKLTASDTKPFIKFQFLLAEVCQYLFSVMLLKGWKKTFKEKLQQQISPKTSTVIIRYLRLLLKCCSYRWLSLSPKWHFLLLYFSTSRYLLYHSSKTTLKHDLICKWSVLFLLTTARATRFSLRAP